MHPEFSPAKLFFAASSATRARANSAEYLMGKRRQSHSTTTEYSKKRVVIFLSVWLYWIVPMLPARAGGDVEAILRLVNQARARSANSGGRYYRPAPPLRLSGGRSEVGTLHGAHRPVRACDQRLNLCEADRSGLRSHGHGREHIRQSFRERHSAPPGAALDIAATS